MKPQALMEKASRAAASAQLLLDAGDVEGACNRAYYAMFDAAKAALFWCGASVEPTAAKTHSSLISVFSMQLVKTGRLPVDLGKALNRVAEIRLIADYTGGEVTAKDARWAIEQAVSFVEAVRREFAPQKQKPN